jgi:MFS family permease
MFDFHRLFNNQQRLHDQQGLWATSFFRTLAFALVSIFIPIFIFEFGRKNFGEGGMVMGIALVLIYRLIIRITVGLLGIPTANFFIRRIGYKKSVMIALLITSLSFFCFSLAEYWQSLEMILAASFLIGIEIILYWVSYNTLFTDDSEENSMGKSLGKMTMFSGIGEMVAPLIGGVLVVTFGFSGLFLAGLVIFLIAGIPMWFLGKHKHEDSVSWSEFKAWCQEKTFLRLGAATGGTHIHEIILADLWPVYVFLLIGSIKAMGVFTAIIALASLVFFYLVAWMFDKKSIRGFQIMGVGGGVMIWLLRTMVTTFGQIVMFDSLDRFFYAMSSTYFSGYMFKRAKGPETFSFMVYREIWLSVWTIGVYGLLLLLLVVLPVPQFWNVAFLMGAAGLTLGLLVKEHK